METKRMKTMRNTLTTSLIFAVCLSAFGQTTTKNHVKTYTAKEPISTTLSGNTNKLQTQQTIQYLDGLGRPEQLINRWASPESKDMIVPYAYDEYGRQTKNYLPYESTTNNTHFRLNALTEQDNFYDNDYPFSERRFDDSPLNRVLEQASPGAAWRIGQHTLGYSYETNTAEDVVLWELDDLQVSAQSYYPVNKLYQNSVTDEDGNTTVTFTDLEGKTLLKKSEIEGDWAEIYYIYDQFDRLRCVLPPQGTAEIETYYDGLDNNGFVIRASNHDITGNDAGKHAYTLGSTITVTPGTSGTILSDGFHAKPITVLTPDFLEMWAFQYEYDERDRMISKQVPGADPVHMVYDRWDRLVLTQDGNQRNIGEWLFTSYDALNRPVMTGFVSDTRGRAAMQTYVEGLNDRHLTFTAGTGSNLTHQYSETAYPLKNTGSGSLGDILTVTYYDNHDFTSASYSRPSELNTSDTSLILPENFASVKGLVTGTLIDDGTGTGTFLETVSFYDDKYRMIQIRAENAFGQTDVVSNQYNFIGNVRRSKTVHSNGVDTYEILRRFEYDHADRLKEIFHTIDSIPEQLLVENNYNARGELEEKNLHGNEQSIDYAYNIRGWLTDINNATLSGGDEDLFGMELHYNTSAGLSGQDTLYNGNISAMTWSDQDVTASGNTLRGYTYTYDQLNRLTGANHFEQNVSTNKYGVSDLTYDLNGNIETLNRQNESTSSTNLMDELVYEYQGNQLLSVLDDGDDAQGFEDGNTSGDDYGYDPNGNLTFDKNKGITLISYNHLNLPEQVTLLDEEGNEGRIEYQYDAAGIKLKQTVVRLEEQEVFDLLELYASNFSSGLDGWTTYQTIGQANWDYAGQVDAVKVTTNSATNLHRFQQLIGGGTGGKQIQVKARVYLPSSNTSVDGIQIQAGFNGGDRSQVFTTKDQWTTILYTTTGTPNGGFVFFRMMSGQADSFQGSNNDIFYIKDIEVSEVNGSSQEMVEVPTVTDYVGEFIYETIGTGNLELQLIQHEEGRVILSDSEGPDYQYHLKDHLGNTRLTFSTTPENYEMEATMEDSNEASNFSNYLATSDGAAANSGTHVFRNSNTTNDGLGMNTFLSVNKGDTIKTSAFAYYNHGGSSYTLATGFIEDALFGSFNTNYGAEGATVTQSNFDGAFGGGTALGGRSSTSSAPQAFINYIFFDRDMNYEHAGFKQITGASNGTSFEVTADDFVADQNGYIMVYLSNETTGSALTISWDDFTVYHGKTNVVQADDYYPFGLTFNGYQRTASKKNFMNTFQDQEYDEETGWVQFKWRNHMPEIGRFFNVDPLAEKYLHNSPYAFSENKLISFRELEGLEAQLSIAGLGAQGGKDDKTFVKRSKDHAKKTGGTQVSVNNGSELVDALSDATAAEGSIQSVTIFSHGGPDAIYLDRGEGFYTETMTNDGAGATDINDLNAAMESGSIVFESGASLVIGGCNCGETLGPEITKQTGVTTISSTSFVEPEIVGGSETGRLVSSDGGSFIKTEVTRENLGTAPVPGRINADGTRQASGTLEVKGQYRIQQTNLGSTYDPN